MLMVMPIIGTQLVPTRVRLYLALAITIVLVPVLPPMPQVDALNLRSLLLILEQVLIGAMFGFILQLFFHLFAVAGQIIAMQMGLGFASLLDPTQTESSMLLGRFLSLTAVTAFIAGDGHLVLVHALFDSFTALPVSAAPLGNPGWQTLAGGGTIVFALALRIALPIIAIMMIVNLGFAVLSRTAQALNPFAVGIAATLVVGLMLVMVMMTSLAPVVERSVMDALDLGGRAFSQFSTLPR
jgi:flagellar biosynthetic protein FliR